MRCEIPEIGRCCFCFPLRFGLLVWCYAKLVASVMLLTIMLINMIGDWNHFWNPYDITFTLIYLLFVLSLASDVVFLIIFVISAHKKDPKIMDWFAKFCIYMFVMYALGLCLSIAYASDPRHFLGFFIGFTLGTICFSCLVSQAYMLILVRSEILKLKRGKNYEFINQIAETTSAKIDANDTA